MSATIIEYGTLIINPRIPLYFFYITTETLHYFSKSFLIKCRSTSTIKLVSYLYAHKTKFLPKPPPSVVLRKCRALMDAMRTTSMQYSTQSITLVSLPGLQLTIPYWNQRSLPNAKQSSTITMGWLSDTMRDQKQLRLRNGSRKGETDNDEIDDIPVGEIR
jgi:hypothetical protein